MADISNRQETVSQEVPSGTESNKVLYIVVSVLLTLVLGLGGYLVYERYSDKNISDNRESEDDDSDSEDSDENVSDEDFSRNSNNQTDNGVADDPYQDWKTYTNTTGWNLSFQYPSSASLSSVEECIELISESAAGPCFATRVVLDADQYPPFEAFQIEAYNGEYSDLDERFNDGLGSPWGEDLKTGEIDINGYKGKYMTGSLHYEGLSVQFSKRIYVHTGDNLFLIFWVDKEGNPNGDIAEMMFDSLVLK